MPGETPAQMRARAASMKVEADQLVREAQASEDNTPVTSTYIDKEGNIVPINTTLGAIKAKAREEAVRAVQTEGKAAPAAALGNEKRPARRIAGGVRKVVAFLW